VVSGQRIVKGPVNTAAKVSSQAFFNCTGDTGTNDHVIWEYSPQPPTFDRIYTSPEKDVVKDHRDKFGIQQGSAKGEYNLIIKNVQMYLGVTYVCRMEKGTKKAAELIALGTLRSLLSSYCQCQARTYQDSGARLSRLMASVAHQFAKLPGIYSRLCRIALKLNYKLGTRF